MGSKRFVTTEGLRLRDAPNGKVLRELTIAEPVEDLGPGPAAGWRQVQTMSGTGVVFEKYLRKPVRPEVESLLRVTVDEWLRFEKGQGNEKVDPYCGYVGQMWAAIGLSYDGRSTYASGEDVPWSAAFISWVVRQAGPGYSKFKFDASHSTFVNDAIKAQITQDKTEPFWGYHFAKQKPEIGDIIQRNRKDGKFSFSHAENHTSYASHSDIVVEVTEDVARVIGGNVRNTVSATYDLQEYSLDAHGFLEPGQRLISILKNRAGL